MATRRVLYTDGARDPATRYAGCSYVFFSPLEGCWRGASRGLGRVDDSSDAELAAINDALEFVILSNGSAHVEELAVLILSDALWMVDAIKGHRYGFEPASSLAIQEIVHTIHKLEVTEKRVSVEWVAAHRGTEGNEVADFTAREAKLRSPHTLSGKASLTMPVKLWSPGPEEEARYTRPGPIEFSEESERLLLNAASDRSLPRSAY